MSCNIFQFTNFGVLLRPFFVPKEHPPGGHRRVTFPRLGNLRAEAAALSAVAKVDDPRQNDG